MPRIAFVNPLTLPLDLIEDTWSEQVPGVQNLAQEGISLPMGILYLSAYLKRHLAELDVDLIDYRIEYPRIGSFPDLDSFIRDVAQSSVTTPPDVLAFSLVVSTSHQFFTRCLTLLKALWPDTVIIAGGFHATNFTAELLALPNVDYIFRGESEYALRDFMAAWPELNNASIPGVVSKKSLGPAPPPLCLPLVSMDDNPIPDYELADMSRYVVANTRMVIKQAGDKQVLSANVVTSLGCPFCCTFCASRTVHGRKMRYKSIDNVVAEFRLLHERYGVTLFMPEDDLFTANSKRTLALLDALRTLGIPGFRMQFPVALSVNTLTRELIDALVDAGLDVASLAIESGCEYTQHKIIRKGVDLARAREWVRYLREKRLPVRASFILGFPGETRAMMDESIEYARTLGADWYDFFIATPLAGSEMCSEFIKMGCLPDDINVISRGYYSRRNFDTPEISCDELVDLVYRANLLCNFRDNINLRRGEWQKGLELFRPIADKYPFHIIALDCLHRCYGAIGDLAKSEAALHAIVEARRCDPRAGTMMDKYGDLLSPAARTALRMSAPSAEAPLS